VVPVTKSYAGSQLTLDPDAPLQPGVVYQVSLGSGIKAATDGRSLKSTSFRFTTSPVVPPTLVSSTPADSDTGVGLATGVEMVFSKGITGYTRAGAVTLTEVATGEEIPYTRGYYSTSNTLRLNPFGGASPERLKPGTVYRVTLNGNGNDIRSVDEGAPLPTTSFTFTTATKPTVVAMSPSANATGVSTGTGVQITFSEDIIRYAAAGAVTITEDETGDVIPYTRGYNADAFTLRLNPFGGASPERLKPGTVYRVTLNGSTDALRSASGRVPLDMTTFTFTTRE
jgi:hypothetical protein